MTCLLCLELSLGLMVQPFKCALRLMLCDLSHLTIGGYVNLCLCVFLYSRLD